MTLRDIRTRWIKARIAYHRRRADFYNRPIEPRSFKRDGYQTWLRSLAVRHSMKASELERKLLVTDS